jgi:hypothetical protein
MDLVAGFVVAGFGFHAPTSLGHASGAEECLEGTEHH